VRYVLLAALEARPLLGLATALVAGSVAGALWAEALGSVDLLRATTAAAVVAWTAFVVGRCDTRLVRVGLLVTCAAVAALRAHAERTLEREASAASVQTGAFTCTRGSDGVLARLGLSTRSWAMPAGLAHPGEHVVVDPVHEPPAWPRGPEVGPRSLLRTRPTVELSAGEIVRVAPARSAIANTVSAATTRLRSHLVERTSSIDDPTTRALVTALLFGDTSLLPQDLPDLFVRTGTFHVLAVSGMQVVLVLLFLIGPMSALCALVIRCATRGAWRPALQWFALPALLLFVPIAGGGAPIVRSALGAAFASIAPHLACERAVTVEANGRSIRVRLARRADALSCWALALVIECAWHPLAPLSLSVQLSYAATFGLIVGTRPCLALVRNASGTGSKGALLSPVTKTGRTRSPWLVVGVDRAVYAACCALAASCAAVLATLPFVWERLGEWSPWGVLATPVSSAPSALLFVGGWLEVACPWLVPDVFLDLCGSAMVSSMRAFDLLPGTPAPLAPRPFVAIAVLCAATLFVLRAQQRTHLSFLIALAWAGVIVPWNPTPARVEIYALDVGAGTAVVIEGPGLGTFVFDAGSRDRPDVAREALAPLLRRIDPGSIGVVLSHADRDHDGALSWLVERYPPHIFAGALPAPLVERLPRSVPRLALEIGTLRLAGDATVALDLQRGLSGAMTDNEASYVLNVIVRGERAVLFGDAEERGLDAWLARCKPLAPVRLVLWPHHGSDTDRLDALVRATRPDTIWISASGRPRALLELERRALVTECTARDGPLTLILPADPIDAKMDAP